MTPRMIINNDVSRMNSALVRVGCLCLLAGVGVLAGGCDTGGGKALVMQSGADFDSTIQSDKPVLMMFFKGGCATCAALEPVMDKLAGEYEGRAVVAKIMVLELTFTSPSPEIHAIKEKYDVFVVPQAMLFVHGQAGQRFEVDYDINHYRKALDAALGTPAANPKK